MHYLNFLGISGPEYRSKNVIAVIENHGNMFGNLCTKNLWHFARKYFFIVFLRKNCLCGVFTISNVILLVNITKSNNKNKIGIYDGVGWGNE